MSSFLKLKSLQEALEAMDTEWLSATQLLGLLKATPEERESKDLQSYLKVPSTFYTLPRSNLCPPLFTSRAVPLQGLALCHA